MQFKLSETESQINEYEDSIFVSGGVVLNEYYGERSQDELHSFACSISSLIGLIRFKQYHAMYVKMFERFEPIKEQIMRVY